jgi:hypothetical protein
VDWYLAILPILILCFSVSFIVNIFRDFMDSAAVSSDSISQVEVVNTHDFYSGRR